MGYLSFPENIVIINALAPIVGAGVELTTIPISLKYVQKLWAVCQVNVVGDSAAVACVPQTDSTVAAGTWTILPATLHNVPIWVQLDAATTNVVTQQTDATNYSTLGNANRKVVIFEIMPELMRTTVTAASDDVCFRISFTTVAAGDYVSALYVIQPRYPSKAAQMLSFIAD